MKKLILLFIIFIVGYNYLQAQSTFYFMDYLPQRQMLNPSNKPKNRFHLQFPLMGLISVQGYNSDASYNDFMTFIDNISLNNGVSENFVNSLGKDNHSQFIAQANLLSFGFSTNYNDYLSFNLNLNSFSELNADSEFAYLLSKREDINDIHFPIVIDDVYFVSNNYISAGLTYARTFFSRLTIGITPKINFNLFGINANAINIHVDKITDDTGVDEYEYTARGDIALGLPVPINAEALNGDELNLDEDIINPDSFNDYKFSNFFDNKSYSFDIGATYRIRKWTFSASIIDLGNSKWYKGKSSYRLKWNQDKIKVKEEDISVTIPTKIYAGAKYKIFRQLNVGLLYTNIKYFKKERSFFTLSANSNLGRMLSLSLSYSTGYDYNNLGAGLRLRFIPAADLFIVTDNLIQGIQYKNAKHVNVALGINFSVLDYD